MSSHPNTTLKLEVVNEDSLISNYEIKHFCCIVSAILVTCSSLVLLYILHYVFFCFIFSIILLIISDILIHY